MSFSDDEEEIIKNFDEEADLIVQTETLPKKSSDRYLLVYNTYKKWLEENRGALSNSEENNLIVYFNQLKQKLKPSTLWSVWSMLRNTLSSKEKIDIKNFLNLKILIKNNAKGYTPTKALALKWEQIEKFMKEAPDHSYLAAKVILIFGICGALRCDEITYMKCTDVEDLNNKFLVSVNNNKNDYPGQFVIGNLFYATVKQYMLLRPTDEKFSDRFFVHFDKGKCTKQNIGRHTIGGIPQKIAQYLNLDNAAKYTGHCFRRTSATLLSESGANMQMIKQLGRWRSDIIAQGYIENSMHNRELIFNGITHKNAAKNTVAKPSISTENNFVQPSTSKNTPIICNELDSSNYQLAWDDFSEDFDVSSSANEINTPQFVTSNGKNILITQSMNQSDAISAGKFFNKPPVKLNFNQQTSEPPRKKRNTQEQNSNIEQNVLQDLNQNAMNEVRSSDARFSNCTFNNCVFNITCQENLPLGKQ